jgi:dihydroorotase
VPLVRALARVTSLPAAILGVNAGAIGVGAPADVVVFDPRRPWRVERGALASQGKNTPFLGLELEGRVRATLVGGAVVHECA